MKLVRLGHLAAFNPSQSKGSSRGVWIRIELGAARGSKRSNWGGAFNKDSIAAFVKVGRYYVGGSGSEWGVGGVDG